MPFALARRNDPLWPAGSAHSRCRLFTRFGYRLDDVPSPDPHDRLASYDLRRLDER